MSPAPPTGDGYALGGVPRPRLYRLYPIIRARAHPFPPSPAHGPASPSLTTGGGGKWAGGRGRDYMPSQKRTLAASADGLGGYSHER